MVVLNETEFIIEFEFHLKKKKLKQPEEKLNCDCVILISLSYLHSYDQVNISNKKHYILIPILVPSDLIVLTV